MYSRATMAHRQERLPQDDLEPGDDYLELAFDELLIECSYRMTKHLDPDFAEVIFENLPYAQMIKACEQTDEGPGTFESAAGEPVTEEIGEGS
jgi:hypothetical protein